MMTSGAKFPVASLLYAYVCINVGYINENARYSARRSRCRRRARTRDQFALRFRRSTTRPPTPRRHRNYTKLSRITAVGS